MNGCGTKGLTTRADQALQGENRKKSSRSFPEVLPNESTRDLLESLHLRRVWKSTPLTSTVGAQGRREEALAERGLDPYSLTRQTRERFPQTAEHSGDEAPRSSERGKRRRGRNLCAERVDFPSLWKVRKAREAKRRSGGSRGDARVTFRSKP
jgi:hypothetical protein